MLSPQEIKNIQFDKVMFGGYEMAAVDETMQEIASDFNEVVRENASLKSKLKLLAKTIDEYREVDEAMRKALITAQNLANDMVKEAKRKADEIIANASAIAQSKVKDLASQITDEEKRLAQLKADAAIFIDAMSKAYRLQSEKLESLRPDVEVTENATVLDDTLTLAAREISKCVESAIENMKVLEERAKVDDISSVAPNVDAVFEETKTPVKETTKKEEKTPIFDSASDNIDDTRDFDQVTLGIDGTTNTPKDDDDDDDDYGVLKFGRNYDYDEE